MSGRNGHAKRKVSRGTDTIDLTPKKKGGKTFPFRLVFNSSDPRTDLHRRAVGNSTGGDPRRDFNEECGWPDRIVVKDYFDLHRRNDYANRVNTIYSDECFAVTPEIYETDRPRFTDFEKDVLAYTQFDENGNPVNPETNLVTYWHRVDIDSGIGYFGALLLGIDDGKKLSEPVAGLDPTTGEMDETPPERRKLLYMRSLNQQQVTVKSREEDFNNPRHGKPKVYKLKLPNLSVDSDYTGDNLWTEQDVHWTRVIHVAEGGEVMGVPRTEVVYNRLLDISKILGGGAEMFYQGGFPGVALTLDPKMLEAGLPEVDEDTIDEQMYLYMNRLQRYLHLVGYEAKSLAPNIADPQGNLTGQLQAVATAKGIPLRIFLGAEQAQLASGQDVRTWNRRLTRRMNGHLTANIIRPTIDRLVAIGVVRPPKKGKQAYRVFWPDINMPNDDEKSTVADRMAASLMKYVQGKVWKVIQPSDFLRIILGRTPAEVDVIIENAKKEPELDLEEPLPQPGAAGIAPPGQPGQKPPKQKGPLKKLPAKPPSIGVKGDPPSDPPRGGKTQ